MREIDDSELDLKTGYGECYTYLCRVYRGLTLDLYYSLQEAFNFDAELEIERYGNLLIQDALYEED